MIEKINSDLKEAMLSGDALKVEVLKGLKNSIKNFQIEKRRDTTEEEIIRIVQKEIKQRNEAAEIYSKAGATDRSSKEKKEVQILETYLPEQMDEQQVSAIVDKVIKEHGVDNPKQLGMVIGMASKEIAGRAEGALIAAIAKKKLGV